MSNNEKMSVLLAQALRYAERGWCILPIGDDKRAAVQHWESYQTQRPTEYELRGWFHRRNVIGLAAVCGPVSGALVVRDFDSLGGYRSWADEYPSLAKVLPTSETARGRHVFFSAAFRQITKLADGELRGAGYVLLPPSMHPSGVCYRWLIPPSDDLLWIDDLQGAGLFCKDGGASRDSETVSRGVSESGIDGKPMKQLTIAPKFTTLVQSDVFRSTLPTQEGTRNHCIFRLVRLLKWHPACEGISPSDLEGIVRYWHSLALPSIRTKDFETTWTDFEYAWEVAHTPLGQGLPAEIMDGIPAAVPDEMLPRIARKYESQDTRRLVLLCQKLQTITDPNPFFLSATKATELLGLPTDDAECKRIGRLLERRLTKDGILRLVRKGNKRVANRYRYLPKETD